MDRSFPFLAILALLAIAGPAPAATIDLMAGTGTLVWDTSVSVSGPAQNASVTHPLFPGNRHKHEGWFLYVAEFDALVELTNFVKTSDGASQDVIETTVGVLTETFELELTYGLSAVGPDGLPQLDWSGSISRNSPGSPFQLLTVRLFNVFDYDIGADFLSDSASVTVSSSPDSVLIEMMGTDGVDGSRGVYGLPSYTADTRSNVLDQILIDNALNDSIAGGTYDVAGAFEWTYVLCYDPLAPECQGGGPGSGGPIGGFGNFGAIVPEPSTGALLGLGLVLCGVQRRRT